MRILVTAGPTREYIDDVRFLTNSSSGLMGYALVEAALSAGFDVTLVSGPVNLAPPSGCQFVAVETTEQMAQACLDAWGECCGVIGAAAVCDYRPKVRQSGKLKKTGQPLVLELDETTDILASLGAKKGNRFLIGFALESQDSYTNAARKLKSKNCDAIILNSPLAINSRDNSVELILPDGTINEKWVGAKRIVADRIIDWISKNLISKNLTSET